MSPLLFYVQIREGSTHEEKKLLPPMLSVPVFKSPNIQISLVEESSANLSLLLQAGKLDLMIDNCILDEQIFDHYVYQKEYLLLAVPKSYSVNTRLQEYQIPIRPFMTVVSFLRRFFPFH